MKGNIVRSRLAVIGIIISAIGALGTYYQVFGQRTVWIALIVLGFACGISYLWEWGRGIRTVVSTFGARWSLENGQLIIGNTVNVALRTKTLQHLLDTFHRATGDDFSSIVKEAGRRIGQNFADDLKKELTMRGIKEIVTPGKAPSLLERKLRLWARYDSSTGMGIFETDHLRITVDGLQGHILLRNSFLAHDRRSEPPSCTFIEGYIEGVIAGLCGIHVAVKETECSAVTSSAYCKFEITQKH